MGCSSPVAAVARGGPNLCVIAGGHNGPGPQTGHHGHPGRQHGAVDTPGVTTALWQTRPTCSLKAFSSISDGSRDHSKR